MRSNLDQNHKKGGTQKVKDVLFVDVVLEAQIRALTEKIMHIDIGFESYLRECSLLLANLSMSFEWNEIKVLKEDWDKIVFDCSKNLNLDNARKLKSVIDRAKQALGEVNDALMGVI